MYLKLKIKCLSVDDATVYYKMPDVSDVVIETSNALALLGDSIIVKTVDVVQVVSDLLTYQECIYIKSNGNDFENIIVHSNIVLNKILPENGRLLDIRRQF